ncbi:glycosyltransferase family 4 protein [Paenibacillus sp. IB182496]|uniref:Glycosyltransferase family 4 protein n=1 Tax=Paenibacillus sabuli TaxID=2772509 RepID=A0A927GT12_9BACL|nr:glycosyltransferase family 4 protein [Paenibacillus sabuli]MBD2847128.1 glycosyltransferase family 4 protein [Paenibacillus sabuli]
MTKRKPTVVYVAHDAGGSGGMELHLDELLSRLGGECEVIVVACSMKVRAPDGIRFIRIPVIRRPAPLKTALFAVLASLRIALLRRDLLHTTGAIVFNRADVSTVHFCHAGYRRAAGQTRTRGQGLWRSLNSRLAAGLARWLERRIYRPRRTRQLVAVSRRVRQEVLEAYPYGEREVTVIPNGVDLTRFRPCESAEKRRLRRRFGLPEAGVLLLFMGGDWPRKGLDLVVQAFAGLAGDYKQAQLVVVGRGDERAYTAALPGATAARIHFAGHQPEPEAWLGLSDVFVFPSSYETFSLVVHEAAAAQLAIVATRVGGVEDLIRDGEDGLYIERSAQSIERALRRLLDDPALRRRLGESAGARVAALTWERAHASMTGLYDELLAARQPERGRGVEPFHP